MSGAQYGCFLLFLDIMLSMNDAQVCIIIIIIIIIINMPDIIIKNNKQKRENMHTDWQ